MEALAIVKALDIRRAPWFDVRRTPWFDEPQEGRAHCLPGFERAVDIQFRLEAAREALHRRVVEAMVTLAMIRLMLHPAVHPNRR